MFLKWGLCIQFATWNTLFIASCRDSSNVYIRITKSHYCCWGFSRKSLQSRNTSSRNVQNHVRSFQVSQRRKSRHSAVGVAPERNTHFEFGCLQCYSNMNFYWLMLSALTGSAKERELARVHYVLVKYVVCHVYRNKF